MTSLTLQDIINALDLQVLTNPKGFQQVIPTSGYASDLLSCVMAGAKGQSVWVTLQAHANVVAVSALLEVSAVIITENAMPEQAVIDKANEEGITLLSTGQPTFYVVGKLWDMGLRN
jgi:predicted transcriptional regulator